MSQLPASGVEICRLPGMCGKKELPVETGACPPVQICEVDKSHEGKKTNIFVVLLQKKCPEMVKAFFPQNVAKRCNSYNFNMGTDLKSD